MLGALRTGRQGPVHRNSIHVYLATFILVVVTGLTLAGCSDSDEVEPLDGEVTLVEYHRALERARTCVEEAGFTPTGIQPEANGVLWTFGISDLTDDETEKAGEISDACIDKYAYEAEKGYFLANVPTGTERDELMSNVIECLESVGVSNVSPTDTREEITTKIVDTLPEYGPGLMCLEQGLALFPEVLYPSDE